jgi:hypothetical protein
MSQQRPTHKRRYGAQGAPILDGGHVNHIEADRTDHTPALSTEHIIVQLQQLRDLLPAPGKP